MAYRTYKDSLNYNESNARLLFDENYLIKNLLNQHKHSEATGSSIIDFIEPFSPVDELVKSSKVVRTGKGGVPSKVAFKKTHRNIHPSYIGNIAAHSTSESSDVGLINFHTLGSFITKDFGLYGNKFRDNNNWDSVGIDEALIPFQNSMDSDRLILARTHMGQKIPVLNAEPPLLQSGAEHIVPQITSPKFGHVAKKAGKVIKVEKDKFITVEYSDGEIEVFDIIPRYSSTKRNSTIRITLETLNEGDTFNTNQLISWSKSFVDNVLAIGKNKRIAILNYIGVSHEDGYVITEDMADDFKTELIYKIPVIIPPGVKIIQFNKNKITDLNDVLIEFQYNTEIENVDEYISKFELIDSEFQEDIENLYQQMSDSIKIYSPGGEVVDIKIKINNNAGADPIILNEWEEQKNNIRKIQKELNKNSNKNKKLLDNIDMSVIKIGTHKIKGNEFEGVLIEFYLNVTKPAHMGNKFSNRFGAKGVINHIIDKDNTPYGEYSGNIDIFLAPASILGRKNTVILKELYLTKILYSLKNIVKELLETGNFEKTKETIIYTYSSLDPESDQTNFVINSLNNYKEKDYKELLNKIQNESNFQFNFIVPPFHSIKFKNIKIVANKLKIPLDERIFIKELGVWTKKPVPVGYAYMSAMEQLSSDYESTRSRGSYVGSTGQPVTKKSRMGGQNIGNLDIFNLLTYDANNILKELMTVRSDNTRSKNEVINNIISTGKSNMPENIKKGKTQNLFNIMMLSIGLNIRK